MRRLLPAPKVKAPAIRRREVATATSDAAAALAAVESVQAAPVVTTAATDAFSGEQVITGTPDGTKFLRDDLTWQTASGGSGAPTTAQYVTLATDATLSSERVLTAGSGISITDAGAGSTVTIAATSSGGGSDFGVLDWLGW